MLAFGSLIFFKEYLDEFNELYIDSKLRHGIYSLFDCMVLYSVIRKGKPKVIVDFSPGKGRTTSCMINALKKNQEEKKEKITYFAFERKIELFKEIENYLNEFDFLDLFLGGDIVLSPLLNKINDIDFLCVDSNHDVFLARWYIRTLFRKLRGKGSVIHIHDMDYNINGNEAENIRFNATIDHPDIINWKRLKEIYPYFAIEREKNVPLYEGDAIYHFWKENIDNVSFYSTLDASRNVGYIIKRKDDIIHNRTLYFKLETDTLTLQEEVKIHK